MKTILVPVDFSAVTAQVARTACEMARLTGSRLVLLHVLPLVTAFETYGLGSEIIRETAAAREKLRAADLAVLAKRCARTVKSVRTVQQTGNAVPVILEQAKKLKAAYIVLGSHGHGAVYDLVAGSVAQGVLRRAACPVFVVPVRPAAKRR
jgi:nucleotide-binding universal stress UspA family protein